MVIKRKRAPIKDLLLSILYDAEFVVEFCRVLVRDYGFILAANRRSGLAYVEPRLRSAIVYFKSSDGHFGHWDFSLRRMNLHLLDRIFASSPSASSTTKANGCIIVDITKQGKRFPDSLAKTVPIWCHVLNLAFNLNNDSSSSTLELNLPLSISPSERQQIQQRIPAFVELVRKHVPRNQIEKYAPLITAKPLRPLWFHSDSPPITQEMMESWISAGFTPVICLSASRINVAAHDIVGGLSFKKMTTETMMNQLGLVSPWEFTYIQGAADDAEQWTQQCTWDSILTNIQSILAPPIDASDDEANYIPDELLIERLSRLALSTHMEQTQSPCHLISHIPQTTIHIASWQSAARDNVYRDFDLVINCTELTPSFINDSSLTSKRYRYLQLNIAEGKRGRHVFLHSIPKVCEVFKQLTDTISHHPKTLIHCRLGKDRAIGIALCLILKYFANVVVAAVNEVEGNEVEVEVVQDGIEINKEMVGQGLLYIQQYREIADPSRATLKQINTYFMS